MSEPLREEETPTAPSDEVVEPLKDTGILIYHLPTNTRCVVRARVRRGTGRVSVSGTPLTELMARGSVRRFDELLRALRRERLKEWDIDLDLSDPSWSEHLSPSVLAYALTEALTNLLGQL